MNLARILYFLQWIFGLSLVVVVLVTWGQQLALKDELVICNAVLAILVLIQKSRGKRPASPPAESPRD